jgi:hypothetical protein
MTEALLNSLGKYETRRGRIKLCAKRISVNGNFILSGLSFQRGSQISVHWNQLMIDVGTYSKESPHHCCHVVLLLKKVNFFREN